MSNRFQFVSASGSNSNLSKLDYGVPEGSALGQVFFVLYTQPISQILFNHSCPHQFFADDIQLRKSCSPEHYDDTRNALQTCISDIKDWMVEKQTNKQTTSNKVQTRQTQCCSIPQNSNIHLNLSRSAKPPFPSPTQSGTLVST